MIFDTQHGTFFAIVSSARIVLICIPAVIYVNFTVSRQVRLEFCWSFEILLCKVNSTPEGKGREHECQDEFLSDIETPWRQNNSHHRSIFWDRTKYSHRICKIMSEKPPPHPHRPTNRSSVRTHISNQQRGRWRRQDLCLSAWCKQVGWGRLFRFISPWRFPRNWYFGQ